MSAIPPISSSNSRSSNTLTRSGGMSSLKPATKAVNCSSTRFWILHSVIRLQKVSNGKSAQRSDSWCLLDIFLLVLVGHFNIPSVGLKIDCDSLPKSLILCGESNIQNVFNIIVSRKNQQSHRLNWAMRLTASSLDSGGNQHQPPPYPPKILFSAGSSCKRRQ